MSIFFTSDKHIGHSNIIKYCNRPFRNVNEMNKAIVDNHNAIVDKKDIVYDLGDFGWFKDMAHAREIIQSLNGQHFLIKGNHDHKGFLTATEDLFVKIKSMHTVKVPDPDAKDGKNQYIILCHYPLMVWNRGYHGAWHLHGHCHGNLQEPFPSTRMDVGVDCFNFSPVPYSHIKHIMSNRKYNPVDHHKEGET
jgi:calcineurin-like phosphoesterase family protein